ncbi:amino acid adenylation domain-containing protein [Pseudomonas frederiksbergensis]|uniref:non-ribosomal peptide synthetase n=1 Tax=Pseudomonas frederiksbergensis TaxID=104087 RepID=UPI003D22E4F3
MDILNSVKRTLTVQQRALWFLAHCSSQDVRYNIGQAMRVHGEFDVAAFELSVRRLVARTPVLRSTFPGIDGKPGLVINDQLEAPLMRFDARNRDEQYLVEQIQDWFYQPFDLAVQSSLRFGLFERGAHEHVLVICAHHIITDFTSLGLILDQLECLYLEEVGSDTQRWFTASRPFADYVALEQSYFADQGKGETEAYWLTHLKQPPPALSWSRHWRQGSTAASSHYFTVEASCYRAIKGLAQQRGASVFAIMLAAWTVTVAQESNSHDVVVGMPTSMRDAEFQNTIGSLFTVLPVRLRMEGSFNDVIQQARSGLFCALDHRQFELAHALEHLGVARIPERNPLFQTTVNMLGQVGQSRWVDLMMAPSTVRVPWAGLALSPWKINQQEGQVDIALEFIDAPDELRCVVKADPRCFSLVGIQTFVERFTQRIDRLLMAPERPLNMAPVESTQDYNTVPGPLNTPVCGATSAVSLVDWIDRQTARCPSRIALREQAQTLDYQALQARSLRLAHHLTCDTDRLHKRIGVALSPGIDAVVAMLSVMRAGAGYVPLDPALPEERLRRIIEQSGIDTVIGNAQTLRQCSWPALPLDLHAFERNPRDPMPALFDNSTGNGLAYSVFTSGSTGDPKGIDVEHHNIVALLEAMYQALDMDEALVWSWAHAASFDLSVWEIWGALCSAGTLLIVPVELRAQPDRLLALLDSEGVNVITQTPSGLKNLLTEFLRGPVLQPPRHWVICGEALPGETARHYLSDRWTLWNLYGPAETTVFATIEKVTEALTHFAVVPLGRPLACATLYVRDRQQTPALGQQGEILIGGAGVARGYVGLAATTAERFVDDPYLPAGRAYLTGDLGYWDGERLHFCGRLDDQIKVHGHRVETGEIERCLEAHAQIRQAAVFLETMSGHDRLVAVVLPAEDSGPVEEQHLREHLRKWLPAYMQPTRIVSTYVMPTNRHGKLDRQAVRHQWAVMQRVEHDATSSLDSGNRGDFWRNRLTSIWSDVLGRSDIGLDETFFEIGGNSLALMQVHARLQAWPEGQSLLASDLFRFPTIRTLCDFLRGGDTSMNDAPCTESASSRRQQTLRSRRRDVQVFDVEGGQNV